MMENEIPSRAKKELKKIGNRWYLHCSWDDKECRLYFDGTQYWHQNGKHHRNNDLPAVIYADGNKHWYQNGELHRDNDMPAVICADGTQYWYKNGKCIRPGDEDLS